MTSCQYDNNLSSCANVDMKTKCNTAMKLLLWIAFCATTCISSHALESPSPFSTPTPFLPGKYKQKKTKGVPNNSIQNKQSSDSPSSTTSSSFVRGGSTEGSSIAASVFNLVNNVAGAGILTLAAGKAKGSGWIPSILLCAVLGIISCHTFCIIGQDCEMTGEADFKVSSGK